MSYFILDFVPNFSTPLCIAGLELSVDLTHFLEMQIVSVDL